MASYHDKSSSSMMLVPPPAASPAPLLPANHHHHHAVASTPQQKLMSALLYAASSFSIIFFNKVVLSSTAHGFYGFPSFIFLAAGQFLFTTGVLHCLRSVGRVHITPFSPEVLRVMAPLASIGLANVVCGLGGTQKISLPMFTVLRRFTIPMTMGLEWVLLGVVASAQVQLSVFLMVLGAFVAALSDLSFDAVGYTLILFNNVFTSLNGVVMKRTLTASPSLSKFAVLYYNSLFGAVFMTALLLCKPQELQAVREFASWGDPTFLLTFVAAAGMGSLLNYATFLCTSHNSALSTTVVGCVKNLFTTYFSMLFLSDYSFSLLNFVGISVSVVGSLVYSFEEVKNVRKKGRGPAASKMATNHSKG